MSAPTAGLRLIDDGDSIALRSDDVGQGYYGIVGTAVYGGGVSRATALANARLWAAAPDLLAACEAFLRAPSIGSNGPGSTTIEVQDFNLKAARAAIAKARGEGE